MGVILREEIMHVVTLIHRVLQPSTNLCFLSPPPAEVLWAPTRPRRRALCLGFSYEIHAPPQQLNDEKKEKIGVPN